MIISEEVKSNILNYINGKHAYKDRGIEKLFMDTYKVEALPEILEENIRPLWVGLKVTPKCNMKCEHCWAELKGKEKDFEYIKKAIDKLSELQILHLTISGGEPFLRKDLYEIVKYAKSKRMCLEIFSNGSLIDEEICSKLSSIYNKNIDAIQISLDASERESYYKQRGNDGFDKVIKSIKMLKEYNFIVRVNFTVTHLNQMEIFEAFKLCNTLGVDTFSISHVYDLNKGQNLYEKVDFLTYINEINKCINYAGKFKTELKPFIPVEFFSYVSEKKEFSEVIIEDKTSLLTWFINSSGDIYPDVTLELNEFYIGNIYNDDLEDIYMNIKKIAKKMTKRDLRSSKCSYCNNVNICKGGDLGRTYKRYSNFNQADPRCSFKYKVR